MFTNLETVDATSTQYIKAGVHQVKITKIESSKASNPNANTPYIDFHMETVSGSLGKARLFGDREGQTPEAANFKAKMLKRLLMAAGVTDFKDYAVACKQTVGKKLTAVFATREYWTNDKDGNPVVKSIADYKFPAKIDEEITFEESWNKTLSPEDLRSFNDAKEMAGQASATTVVDDMPF